MIRKFHYLINLHSRPWPVISTLFAGNLFFDLYIFFKLRNVMILTTCLFFLSFSALNWWKNYSNEFNFEGFSMYKLEEIIKFSIILFISSEVIFFFSFFWSYFQFFLSPMIELGLVWPADKISLFDYRKIPLANTIILVSSRVRVTISHIYLIEGRTTPIKNFLKTTIFLGVIFTSIQIIEYQNSFFSIWDSTFGTRFFMLTGFHGIHVFIGTIFLMVVIFRINYLHINKNNFLRFELSSWYWHFVDVVWLFLFYLLYYINN